MPALAGALLGNVGVRARAWPGFAVGQSVCECERVLVGTSHDCVDQPYPGAGEFYAIDN